MSAQPVLEVSEVARRYCELEALRELDLEIGERECVAVIGHNGSGKTTAVRIIAGLLDPSAGSVRIDGARVGAGITLAVAAALFATARSATPDD